MRKNIIILCILIFLIGCEDVEVEETPKTLDSFESITEVVVKKDFNPFYKEYKVKGENINMTLEGKFVKFGGDYVELISNGKVIASEKQEKRWGVKFNRTAVVYDKDKEISWYIAEDIANDFLNPFAKTNIYDKNENKVAKIREKLTLMLNKYEVQDLDGNVLYSIEENFTMFLNEYKITKVKESAIPFETIIFTTLIIDSINSSD